MEQQTIISVNLNIVQTAIIFILLFMLTCGFGIAFSKGDEKKVECAYFRFLNWTYNYGGIDCEMLLRARQEGPYWVSW